MRRSFACLVALLSLAGCTEKIAVGGKEYVRHGRAFSSAHVPEYLTAPEAAPGAEETAEAKHALAEPMIHHVPRCEERLFDSSAPALPKVDLGDESSSEGDFWKGGWTGGDGLPYGALPACE